MKVFPPFNYCIYRQPFSGQSPFVKKKVTSAIGLKAKHIPNTQHNALANNRFISGGCEVMCDVCDISNPVLNDLLYHRAFELPPTVNKKRGKAYRWERRVRSFSFLHNLNWFFGPGKIHNFPAALFGVEGYWLQIAGFLQSLYLRKCQKRCAAAATVLFKHKNWWINFEWRQAWRESRSVRIWII